MDDNEVKVGKSLDIGSRSLPVASKFDNNEPIEPALLRLVEATFGLLGVVKPCRGFLQQCRAIFWVDRNFISILNRLAEPLDESF